MQETYDVTASLCASKAEEGMIAFAGFTASDLNGGGMREGVVKIAAACRPDRNGYLTLTFVLDLDEDRALESRWQAHFRRASPTALAAELGADFETLLDVPLSSFAASGRFYIEELNLYYRDLAGRERERLEGQVIPALTRLLELQFEPLEWVEDGADAAACDALSQRLKRRLAADRP